MFSFLNLNFHWYGLIVGLAVSLVWWLVLDLSETYSVPDSLKKNWWLVIVSALFGARAWHLATDWEFYLSCCSSIGQWWRFLAVWQGGLSILGAILAASLTVRLLAKKHFWLAVDILALSMPLGQAFGRLANWANQELYGKSTTLPWGIQISASHRLASVAELSSNSLFQPLFAYEAIGLIFLTSGLWWFKNHHASWQPGKGKLAMLYLTGYSWLRFSLDFLRLDRGPVWQGLGANQWVLLGVGILCLGFWVESEYKNRL